jgi:hypothetical protein
MALDLHSANPTRRIRLMHFYKSIDLTMSFFFQNRSKNGVSEFGCLPKWGRPSGENADCMSQTAVKINRGNGRSIIVSMNQEEKPSIQFLDKLDINLD